MAEENKNKTNRNKRLYVVTARHCVDDGKKVYNPGEPVKLAVSEIKRLKKAGIIEETV